LGFTSPTTFIASGNANSATLAKGTTYAFQHGVINIHWLVSLVSQHTYCIYKYNFGKKKLLTRLEIATMILPCTKNRHQNYTKLKKKERVVLGNQKEDTSARYRIT
jgi:hypothetical protein